MHVYAMWTGFSDFDHLFIILHLSVSQEEDPCVLDFMFFGLIISSQLNSFEQWFNDFSTTEIRIKLANVFNRFGRVVFD